jgi:hypothetical protein
MRIALPILAWFAILCALLWANWRWRTWQDSMGKLQRKPGSESEPESSEEALTNWRRSTQAHLQPRAAARERRRAARDRQ